MSHQDIDFACLLEEGEELRPMRLRYGVTANEARRREPLALTLSQEEPEEFIVTDGVWDDVDAEVPALARTRTCGLPDRLDEEQIAMAAEQAAMH